MASLYRPVTSEYEQQDRTVGIWKACHWNRRGHGGVGKAMILINSQGNLLRSGFESLAASKQMKGESNQMKAHVICCNDGVVGVFLGDEKDAEDILEKYAKEDREKHFRHDSYEDYRGSFYWHLHTVNLIKGGDTE